MSKCRQMNRLYCGIIKLILLKTRKITSKTNFYLSVLILCSSINLLVRTVRLRFISQVSLVLHKDF